MKSTPKINTFALSIILACGSSMAAPMDKSTHAERSSTSVEDNGAALGLSPSYNRCTDASGGVTTAIANCNAVESAYQNTRLNKAYKTLMDKLSSSDQTRLRDEERQWIAYRDTHCGPDTYGGTREAVESSGCLVVETAKQATFLEAYPGRAAPLTQYEGKQNGVRDAYIHCIRVTRGIGSKAQNCMDAEYTYQVARLDGAYKELTSKLNEGEKGKLASNQKIWLAFRDTHCAPVSDAALSQHPVSNDCLIEETAKQAIALEDSLFFLK